MGCEMIRNRNRNHSDLVAGRLRNVSQKLLFGIIGDGDDFCTMPSWESEPKMFEDSPSNASQSFKCIAIECGEDGVFFLDLRGPHN